MDEAAPIRQDRGRFGGGPVDLIGDYTDCVQCARLRPGAGLTAPMSGDGSVY
jgi:hypothetical protein